MIEDVTIFIKTFRRDDSCTRLIESIRRYYLNLPIIVVNDGNDTVWEGHNLRTILFDEDIGVSRGRNEALKAIDTKYAVQCDDDFIFTERTDIIKWKNIFIEENFDALAGRLWANTPTCLFKNNYRNVVEGFHSETDDVVVADIVPQFLFLDVEKVLSIGGWDEHLDMCEHWTFMYKLKLNGFKVGQAKRIFGKHSRSSKNQAEYDRGRAKKQLECWKKHAADYPWWAENPPTKPTI